MHIHVYKDSLPPVIDFSGQANDLVNTKASISSTLTSGKRITNVVAMKALSSKIMSAVGTPSSPLLKYLSSTTTINNLSNNMDYLTSQMKGIGGTVPKNMLTVKQVELLAMSDMCDVIATNTSEYYVEHMKAVCRSYSKEKVYSEHKPTMRRLAASSGVYGVALRTMCQSPKSYSSKLTALPDANVTSDNEKQWRAINKIKLSLDKITSDFVYNPIYHIRLHLVELQVLRYKTLKQEAQELELLLLALDTEKLSNPRPTIQREIEITEERILVAKRKMKQIAGDSYEG